MPTYYKPGQRKNNRFFVVRGSIDGRKYEIATNAANKKGAEKEWENFKVEIRDAPEVVSQVSFSDAVKHYEATANRAPSQMALVRLVEAYIGNLMLSTIRSGDIRKLAMDKFPGRKMSTLNRNVIAPARAVINCAADDDWCPHIRIKNFKEEEVLKQHPTQNAGTLLMANTEGIQRLYIAILHYHGLRHSDALSLRWENIDLQERVFSIVVPKSSKAKEIVMDDDFFAELANYTRAQGKVFPWINRSGIYSWLTPLCKKLGIKFGSRMARHKFASDLVAEGASAFDLVNNGSWTSEQSVKPYVTLQKERAREMLNRKKVGKKGGNAV
jgi:integrase